MPKVAVVPKMIGRMYKAALAPCGGTKEAFRATAIFTHLKKCSSGTGGIEI